MPDGSVVVGNGFCQIIRIHIPVSGSPASGYTVADETGRRVYVFDGDGRHLRTLDSLTKAVLYSFEYDATGRVTKVTDVNNDATVIQRDANGNPTAIVAPFGQAISLSLDANAYLARITDPVGSTYQFVYSSTGLLQSTDTPTGGHYSYTYDSEGRFVKYVDPLGGGPTLYSAVTATGSGTIVTRTSPMGLVSTYDLDRPP